METVWYAPAPVSLCACAQLSWPSAQWWLSSAPSWRTACLCRVRSLCAPRTLFHMLFIKNEVWVDWSGGQGTEEKQVHLYSPPVPRTFSNSKFSMPTRSTWPVRFAGERKKQILHYKTRVTFGTFCTCSCVLSSNPLTTSFELQRYWVMLLEQWHLVPGYLVPGPSVGIYLT